MTQKLFGFELDSAKNDLFSMGGRLHSFVQSRANLSVWRWLITPGVVGNAVELAQMIA
jgi:hypothetical protein